MSKPPFPEAVKVEIERDGWKLSRIERAGYDFRETEWKQFGQSGGSVYYSASNGIIATAWEVLLKNFVNDPPEQGVIAGAVSFHYPADTAPQYLREMGEPRDCDLLDSGKCLTDFTYLGGEAGIPNFEIGDDAVWDWLIDHAKDSVTA